MADSDGLYAYHSTEDDLEARIAESPGQPIVSNATNVENRPPARPTSFDDVFPSSPEYFEQGNTQTWDLMCAETDFQAALVPELASVDAAVGVHVESACVLAKEPVKHNPTDRLLNTTYTTSVLASSNPSGASRKRTLEKSERDAGSDAVADETRTDAPRKAQKTRRRATPRDQGASTSSGAGADNGTGSTRTGVLSGRAAPSYARSVASAACPLRAKSPPMESAWPPPLPPALKEGENPAHELPSADWVPAGRMRELQQKLRAHAFVQDNRAPERQYNVSVPMRSRLGTSTEPILLDSESDEEDVPSVLAAVSSVRPLPEPVHGDANGETLPPVSPTLTAVTARGPAEAETLPRALLAPAQGVHSHRPEYPRSDVPATGPATRPALASTVFTPATRPPTACAAVAARSLPNDPLPLATTLNKVSRTHFAPRGAASAIPKTPEYWAAIREGLSTREQGLESKLIEDPVMPSKLAQVASSSAVHGAPPALPPAPTHDKDMAPARGLIATELRGPDAQAGSVAVASRSIAGPSRPLEPRGSSGPPAEPSSEFLPCLEPDIVAYDPTAQRRLSSFGIAFGIQYTIAAAVSRRQLEWAEVNDDFLIHVKGSHSAGGYKLPYLFRHVPPPESADVSEQQHAIWREFDREEKGLVENVGRGLGLMGPFEGSLENWHGGQITLRGKLVPVPNRTDAFTIELLPPVLDRKSRLLSRFIGSRRVISVSLRQLNMFKPGVVEAAQRFLARPHIILGRTFILFQIKESKAAWLIETTQDYDPLAAVDASDRFRRSALSVINWCLAPHKIENAEKLFMKLDNRKNLPLSITTPAVEVKQIRYAMDIMADVTYDGNGIALDKTSRTMTDGASVMNQAAMDQICDTMEYGDRRPAAIQGRINMSKGMWALALDPELDADPEPIVIIADSQRKVVVDHDELDPIASRAHRIFCVVRPAYVSPVSLNRQAILCLWANGVPAEVFKNLMMAGIQNVLKPFRVPTGVDSPRLRLLRDAVERAGNVASARVRGVLAGRARAHGHGFSLAHDEDDDGDDGGPGEVGDGDKHADAASIINRHPVSGAPVALHPSAIEMLQAGHDPAQCSVLHKKLCKIIDMEVDKCVCDHHIPLEFAKEATAIPDDHSSSTDGYEALGPGEIYFNPSGLPEDVVEGDVLVYRNPLGLISDCQKVRAVRATCPQMMRLHGVVVFNTVDYRSIASKLSGGDHDGDRVVVIWDPALVSSFGENHDVVPQPPEFLQENFEDLNKDSEHGARHVYKQILASVDPLQQELRAARHIARSLVAPRTGAYSKWSDKATYYLGYQDPKTVRLQWMTNCSLDASKNGLVIRSEVLERDAKEPEWGTCETPRCFQNINEKPAEKQSRRITRRVLPRGHPEYHFILDVLADYARDARAELLKPFGAQSDELVFTHDPDLLAPYATFKSDKLPFLLCGTLPHLRAQIEIEVRRMDDGVNAALLKFNKGAVESMTKSSTERKAKPTPTKMDEAIAEFGRIASDLPVLNQFNVNVDRLLASCAVALSKPTHKFPWAVAHTQLNLIKAEALGLGAVLRSVMEDMTLFPGVVRHLRAQGGEDAQDDATV